MHYNDINYSMKNGFLQQLFFGFNFQYYGKLRANITANQSPDKQAAMDSCFNNLMEGIEYSLLSKNRDKYVFPQASIRNSWKVVLSSAILESFMLQVYTESFSVQERRDRLIEV